MKKIGIIFLLIASLTLVTAQIEIVDIEETERNIINLMIPDPPPFNNITGNTNSSVFADIWVTVEGLMDNVVDLFPTFFSAGFLNDTANIDLSDNNITTTGTGFFDYVGISQSNPLHNLDIVGDFLLTHTATSTDEHALEIKVDAAGYGDVKGIDLFYDTGDIVTGLDEEAILVIIDTFDSTGGSVAGLEVLRTGNTAEVHALLVGIEIDPILQFTGTFGDMDSVDNNGDDDLAEFISTASNVSIFVNDNDYVTIGNAAHFEEMEFILQTPSSINIKPTFEFSTGIGAWTAFTPTDGTNGFENSGVIVWELNGIPTWAVGAGGEYLIRITRTKNNVNTVPIELLVQISDVTEYFWDKNADLSIRNLTGTNIKLSGNLTTNKIFGLGSGAGDIFFRNDTTGELQALPRPAGPGTYDLQHTAASENPKWSLRTAAAIPNWDSVLTSGAASGGNNPLITSGDQLQFLDGDVYFTTSSSGDLVIYQVGASIWTADLLNVNASRTFFNISTVERAFVVSNNSIDYLTIDTRGLATVPIFMKDGLKVWGDITAGSTGIAQFSVGNRDSAEGLFKAQYKSAAPAGGPSGEFTFQPRNNADTGAFEAVNFKMIKTGTVDRGFLEFNTKDSAGVFGERLTLDHDRHVVINEAGQDWNLQVKGDTDVNLLFTDASTDRVGIGTNVPSYLLDVDGAFQATDYHAGSGAQGETDSTSYWLCTAADCSSTCQVTIEDGLQISCT